MKRLQSEITINTQGGKNYTFRYVSNIEIKRSRYNITDTATIEIPKVLKVNQGRVISPEERIFKRGDKITIKLGYFPNLVKRFEGYLVKVELGEVMTLICEDPSYLLKEKVIPKLTLKKTSLKNLLSKISPLPFEAPDTNLGDLRLTNVTAAQVLEKLRQTYGLFSWVEDGVLNCGLLYSERKGKRVAFEFNHNITEDALEYHSEQDNPVKAKAVSLQIGTGKNGQNQKREIQIGDPRAEKEITLFFPENLSEADLKRQGEEKLKSYSFSGLSGSFTTFGAPEVNHSDQVKLIDRKVKDRSGTYWVKALNISFGVDGYRQNIELDRIAG